MSNASIANPVATVSVTTTYTVSVTDNAGCTGTASVTIAVATPPVIQPDSILEEYLTGRTLTATGGVPPYTYTFSPSINTNSLLSLPNNNTTFTITVTGANGCSSTEYANYVPVTSIEACSSLYMSEYIQDTVMGSLGGMNDAIELYNPTSHSINLSNYYLTGTTNGSLLSPPFIIPLSGTISSHSTFLIANSNANISLTSRANMLSGNLNFNGKDIVSLENVCINQPNVTCTFLDEIGAISPRPTTNGWVVGFGSTKNHTLQRRSNVTVGDLNWATGQYQWNVHPQGTLNYIGRYRSVCVAGAAPNLTLSFANATTTCNGISHYFEFDVMVSSDVSSWFDNCVMWIPYNRLVFGDNIVSAGNVTVTAYSNFTSPATYYNPQNFIYDVSPDTLGLPFGMDTGINSWTRTQINSTPQQMLHVKIKVQDCGYPADIAFEDTALAQIFSYYTINQNDSEINSMSYNYTNFTGELHNTVCQVVITGYTNPINAGTNDKSVPANSSIMTITGLGFGNKKGFIQVPDANLGGVNAISLDSTDILSWTNSQIAIKMPSAILGNVSITPGSGHILLFNDCGDSTSKPLTINYNIIDGVVSGEKLRYNIAMSNNNNSLVYRCDTSISNHPLIYAVVLQAIETWNCYTGVNWKMGDDTILESNAQDGISNIYFSTVSLGTPLMQTSPHIDYTYNNTGDSMAYVHEADIAINRFLPAGYSWNYNVSDSVLPGNHYYFYDVILHELGHAHLLNHVDDPTSLMYWTASTNVRKNIKSGDYPGPQTLYGAFDVVNTSAANTPSCSYGILIPSTRNCVESTLRVPSISKDAYNLTLYPNPTSTGTLTISYELTQDSYIQFKIIDYTGRELMTLNDEHKMPGSYKQQINTGTFANGIYLFIANINGNLQTIKFIKL